MMKKWVLLAAAAALAVNVTGCKSGGDAPSGTKNATEASSQAGSQAEPGGKEAGMEESKGESADPAEEEIPNPFKELEGPEGLKELQLNMEVPEGAEDAQYLSIDNEIGEISFVLDGHRYAYRGAVGKLGKRRGKIYLVYAGCRGRWGINPAVLRIDREELREKEEGPWHYTITTVH